MTHPKLRNAAAVALCAISLSCSKGDAPIDAFTSPTPSCSAGEGTTRVPLNDLGTGCYLGFQGGLYPNGSNTMPAAHAAAGRAAAALVRPLDVQGQPSGSGKIVLVSIGMSNTTQEFCSDGGLPGSCQSTSFIAQAQADAAVNHNTLVLVNGAYGGKSADFWTTPTLPDYDRVRDSWLTPLGLSERQVQIVWLKVANPQPSVSLPSATSDAYTMERQLGQIIRALKVRYPNLRQVYLTSRIYAGYATSTLNPEPYAYETGFSVKWAIESQIREMAGSVTDGRAGSLRYDSGTSPWIAWGPYPWANGAQPRSDGLAWARTDFNTSDYTHPGPTARQKIGAMLLTHFKTEPAAQCWFLSAQSCQ